MLISHIISFIISEYIHTGCATTYCILTCASESERLQNIRLTWEAELAQLLPSEATSKSCDKPLTQVEAIVLRIHTQMFNYFF
jgi:hypothetical protein